MSPQAELDSELRRINRSRNRYACLIIYGLLIFSVWYQTSFSGPLNSFILALGGIGCMLRFFAADVIPDEKKISDYFLWLGFALLSCAWVLHIDQTLQLYTLSGDKVPVLRLLVGILVLVNHTFLVADLASHYAFLIPIGAGLVCEIYFFGRFNSNVPLLSYFGISLVSTLGLHFQHRQLRAYILARLEANREKGRLKKIIEGIPGYVAIVDNEGKYIDCNQKLISVFPNLIGSRIGVESRDSQAARFANDFLSSGKDIMTGETEVFIRGVQYNLMTTCGRLDEGAIFISLPTDELVQARKEIRQKEAMALYSSKLASVGQMAAGVAHEVNNPLAIIQGSASIIAGLVQEDNVDRKNLKLFSERIVATSDRIARIVKSLRSLTRGGEQDPFAPLSVKNLISSCQEISGHRSKGHDVTLILPEKRKDMMVLGREVQLGQVLLNLISNSIDAVKELPERWVKIDYGHEDGELWLEVVDSGKGISDEIADKIMEPFFTTKKEEGTGLGLPISLKIMEEHGGKLLLVKGKEHTTFRLRFPTPKI